MFWSSTYGHKMWDPQNDPEACPRGGAGPYDPQCCAPEGKFLDTFF